MGERLPCKQEVASSILVRSTLCRYNSARESATLTKWKPGVRFSLSALDHSYNGKYASLRTKRYGFDSCMVYTAAFAAQHNYIRMRGTGTSLIPLQV